MPIYAAVVLIGAARFLESSLQIDFSIALLILSIIITFNVLFGGIRGVCIPMLFKEQSWLLQ